MNQITPHTEPLPNSKTAAYGYESYSSTPNKSMYLKISKPDYTYFGARYYDSELSAWLSVDPLSDKYPSTSPFMYVGGNPVMITDPDGMDWIKTKAGNYKYDKNITKDSKLNDGETYLGKTKEIRVNDKDGNYQYSYNLNEDGSFSDTRGNSWDNTTNEYDPGFKSGAKIQSNSLPSVFDYKNNEVISHNGNDYILYDNQWFLMMSVEAYKKYLKGRKYSRRPAFSRELKATYAHMQKVVQEGGVYGVVGVGGATIAAKTIGGKGSITPQSLTIGFAIGQFKAYSTMMTRMKDHDLRVDHLRNKKQ
jgi:RHS repeat-associated protein